MAARAHGEVKVDLGQGLKGDVSVEQSASVRKILTIADRIWKDVKKSKIAPNDDAGNDRLLKELHTANDDYKTFATSFPIPFRWMVQTREYLPAAFEEFIRGHIKVMYKDRKEFMATQGEYLVILYKARHPRAGARELTRYRDAIQKSLEEDDDDFAKAREEAEEEVKRIDVEVDEDRRRRVVAYLKNLKANAPE